MVTVCRCKNVGVAAAFDTGKLQILPTTNDMIRRTLCDRKIALALRTPDFMSQPGNWKSVQARVLPSLQYLAAVGSRVPFSNNRSRGHLFLGIIVRSVPLQRVVNLPILRYRKVANEREAQLPPTQPYATPTPHGLKYMPNMY